MAAMIFFLAMKNGFEKQEFQKALTDKFTEFENSLDTAIMRV